MSGESAHLVLVEDVLWIVTQTVGMPRYDFPFEQFFQTRHPIQRQSVRAVARMGAAADYEQRYRTLLSQGIELIHTPAQYQLTSHLPNWYPLIGDLTPRSRWFDHRPKADEISADFNWPVFIKGERQTSRHQRRLSIIDNPEQFEQAMDEWAADPILQWQKVVCREFVPLRQVGEQSNQTIPRSFEFRSFWWGKDCVGIGPYWTDAHYELTAVERADALSVAGEVARRLNVTFLVVDVAQTAEGKWVVIECNDGQDSGYAGVAPMLMWRKVIDSYARGPV